MLQKAVMSEPLSLPDLPLLRTRLTYRMHADAPMPAYKGGMLRGGFGYAFQRATCPSPCWDKADACAQPVICPYRWVFETPRPAGVEQLHNLQDVPRPFVIDLPNDQRTLVESGDSMEFGLTLIGRGIDYLPFFLFGFARLGEIGLGVRRATATVERVIALENWGHSGPTLYADGRYQSSTAPLPQITMADIVVRAATLPGDLRITLRTPLRVKSHGAYLTQLDVPALMRAACWRLLALATFHGAGPWDADYRPVVANAEAVRVTEAEVRWEEWDRHSDHGGAPQRMQLGGIVGRALLRDVPEAVRVALLVGSLVHVGKSCVFGHGNYRLDPV